MHHTEVVLMLGSGPDAPEAAEWDRTLFDRIVVINNAWRIRPDWTDLVYPEDFPAEKRPTDISSSQRVIEADAFVPAQNAYGGFVYAGGTMAYTAAYWALHALRPRVLAFKGCDMVYPKTGATHFYGTGTADPLRDDPTLQSLAAKSARLGVLAARQGCACLNLSSSESELVFPRADVLSLRTKPNPTWQKVAEMDALLQREQDLGYFVPSGRYWQVADQFNPAQLAEIDEGWSACWQSAGPA